MMPDRRSPKSATLPRPASYSSRRLPWVDTSQKGHLWKSHIPATRCCVPAVLSLPPCGGHTVIRLLDWFGCGFFPVHWKDPRAASIHFPVLERVNGLFEESLWNRVSLDAIA